MLTLFRNIGRVMRERRAVKHEARISALKEDLAQINAQIAYDNHSDRPALEARRKKLSARFAEELGFRPSGHSSLWETSWEAYANELGADVDAQQSRQQ